MITDTCEFFCGIFSLHNALTELHINIITTILVSHLPATDMDFHIASTYMS